MFLCVHQNRISHISRVIEFQYGIFVQYLLLQPFRKICGKTMIKAWIGKYSSYKQILRVNWESPSHTSPYFNHTYRIDLTNNKHCETITLTLTQTPSKRNFSLIDDVRKSTGNNCNVLSSSSANLHWTTSHELDRKIATTRNQIWRCLTCNKLIYSCN